MTFNEAKTETKSTHFLSRIWAAILVFTVLAFSGFLLTGCETDADLIAAEDDAGSSTVSSPAGSTGTAGSPASGQALANGQVDLGTIPEYTGDFAVEINGNVPVFPDEDYSRDVFEEYSELDDLGRCGTAYALLGHELMPDGDREDISDVHPSGWNQQRYDFIDSNALYNRSHLIAFKLAGENANEKNLITGTRYMNATGMTEYEDQVSDYIRRTGNHVLYRVTPIFYEDELVARGVHMEAQSVEDDSLSFNVYVYNVQPGVIIDYATGENYLEEGNAEYWDDSMPYAPADAAVVDELESQEVNDYVLNSNSDKFHTADCPGAQDIQSGNRIEFEGPRWEVIAMGYEPCGSCNP